METIVLASASPRRQDYFALLGLPFIAQPSLAEETYNENLPVEHVPQALAVQKALSVAETLCGTDAPRWVFGADTIVAADGRMLGKPKDRDDARAMWQLLRNRAHRVVSGIALYRRDDARFFVKTVVSEVEFAPVSDAEIDWYLDTGEWEGAAGAYKAQGLANCFITGICGSFSNVVGLPLREFYELLHEAGYRYGAGV